MKKFKITPQIVSQILQIIYSLLLIIMCFLSGMDHEHISKLIDDNQNVMRDIVLAYQN